MNTRDANYLNDPWFLSEGRINGRKALVRVRESLPVDVRANTHPHLLIVSWTFGPGPAYSMPDSTASEAMGEFEEQIVGALEKNGLCALFAVVTSDDRRHWKFYCHDIPTVQAVLNESADLSQGLPIELECELDSNWAVYTNLMRDCGAPG